MSENLPYYIKLSYHCPYPDCFEDWFLIKSKTENVYQLECFTCHRSVIGEYQLAQNVIQNPTFQPPYQAQDGIGELKMPQHWRAGWMHHLKRPEWRQASGAEKTPNWENSCQWFCTSDVCDSWIHQSVNVGQENVGKYFRFVVTCALESKNVGSGIGDYFVSIGVDRVGDGNVQAKTVQWITPQHQTSVGKWTILEIIAPIEKEWVGVYIQMANRWKVNGGIFVKSAFGYVIDDPCANVPQPDPQPDPEPIDGECQFDASSILLAIQGARGEIEQTKQAILAELDKTIKRTDKLIYFDDSVTLTQEQIDDIYSDGVVKALNES